MITVTIQVKLILKAFGYTVAVLAGALILATIIWTATGNPYLGTCSFWGSSFLSILAVFTNELKKREAFLTQPSQERPAGLSQSSPPVQALRAPEDHQVDTLTIVDLTCGVFDLHVTRCTDIERLKCILGQDILALRITRES